MESQTAAQPSALPPTPGVRSAAIRKNFFLWLILLCLVVLVCVAFFLFETGKLQTVTQKLTFSEPGTESSFEQAYQKYLAAKNDADKSKYLILSYEILYFDYMRNPTADKHAFLSKVYGEVTKQYPEQFKKTGFDLPCVQTSCGAKVVYTDFSKKFIAEVMASPDIPEDAKQSININMLDYAVANGAGNKDQEYNALNNAFSNLRGINRITPSADAERFAEQLLEQLELSDPERFAFGQEKGFYDL